jgi:hypothetical protein
MAMAGSRVQGGRPLATLIRAKAPKENQHSHGDDDVFGGEKPVSGPNLARARSARMLSQRDWMWVSGPGPAQSVAPARRCRCGWEGHPPRYSRAKSTEAERKPK